MELSILELYILSLIDRGLSSRYELQRAGGVSLGSSVPALRRLQKAKLVVQQAGTGTGERPRHALDLTATGRSMARTGWRACLFAFDCSADIDSIFRLVDMADHYGAALIDIAQFLNAMSARHLATDPKPVKTNWGGGRHNAVEMQQRWTAVRTEAETDFLKKLAAEYRSRRKSVKSRKRSSAKVPTRTR